MCDPTSFAPSPLPWSGAFALVPIMYSETACSSSDAATLFRRSLNDWVSSTCDTRQQRICKGVLAISVVEHASTCRQSEVLRGVRIRDERNPPPGCRHLRIASHWQTEGAPRRKETGDLQRRLKTGTRDLRRCSWTSRFFTKFQNPGERWHMRSSSAFAPRSCKGAGDLPRCSLLLKDFRFVKLWGQ
jgi:hypothetical protein